MAKNFDNLSDNHNDDQQLAWLELHISSTDNLKEKFSRFTEVSTEDNNKFKVDAKELELVSNSKEEKKNIKNLWKDGETFG